MSAFTDFFVNLWENILKPDVEKVEDVAIAFFSAAATDAANQLGVVGLKIVTDAVTAAETAGGTGAQKLAATQASIVGNLATAGIQAASHVINAAIEGAVAQVNAGKTVAAPVEPAVETPAAPSAT